MVYLSCTFEFWSHQGPPQWLALVLGYQENRGLRWKPCEQAILTTRNSSWAVERTEKHYSQHLGLEVTVEEWTQKCFPFKWYMHPAFSQNFLQYAGLPTQIPPPLASLLEKFLLHSPIVTELWTLTSFVQMCTGRQSACAHTRLQPSCHWPLRIIF